MTMKGTKREARTILMGEKWAVSEVRKFAQYSGYVSLPGAWVGKRVKVEILSDNE
jgi:putative transposon-encoded protein